MDKNGSVNVPVRIRRSVVQIQIKRTVISRSVVAITVVIRDKFRAV